MSTEKEEEKKHDKYKAVEPLVMGNNARRDKAF